MATLLTTAEFAAYCKVTRSTLYRHPTFLACRTRLAPRIVRWDPSKLKRLTD